MKVEVEKNEIGNSVWWYLRSMMALLQMITCTSCLVEPVVQMNNNESLHAPHKIDMKSIKNCQNVHILQNIAHENAICLLAVLSL